MSQAGVHSIEALKEFRAALAIFAEDAGNALGTVEMEIHRATRWLQHERKEYWQEQLKRRREKASMAKSELDRRKLSGMFGHASSYSEQKELYERALARLADAEKRLVLIKKWEPRFEHAVLDYHGKSRRLTDLVGGDMRRALTLLDRLLDALDAYVATVAPSGAAASPTESSTADDMRRGDSEAVAEAEAKESPPSEEPHE